jgi:hypothetical protein
LERWSKWVYPKAPIVPALAKESEARPVANFAAYLLQKVIEEAEDQGKIPQSKSGKSA